MPVTLTTRESARINGRAANLRRLRGLPEPAQIFRQQKRVRVALVRDYDGVWLISIEGSEAKIPATDVEYSLWLDLQEATR